MDANPVSTACPASYNVGYQELTFVDSARGRTLNTAIWYPTSDGVPIMLMGGEQDTAAPPELEQKLMYEAIVSTKYLFIQSDAAHFSYLDRCGDDIDLYPLCSALHAQSIPTTTAFWMQYLRNDSTCGDLLRTWVPSLSGVLFQSDVRDAGGEAGAEQTPDATDLPSECPAASTSDVDAAIALDAGA